LIDSNEDPQNTGAPKSKSQAAAKRHSRWTAVGIEFAAMFLFWVLLSGRLQLKYLLIGVCAAAFVTYLTNDLLFNVRSGGKKTVWNTKTTISCAFRLLKYTAWLVVAIVKANIQVASIVLKPKLKVDPGFLKFDTDLLGKVSRVTLANSITLTPGTITVEQKNCTYIVHALVREAAGDIETGLMQDKVRDVFFDREGQPPVCLWAHSRKELES